MSNILHEKATLYLAGLWGYDRVEASDVTWRFQKHVQFPNAARLEYTVRGKRKRQTAIVTTVPVVVLDGWGHPAPPPMYGPPTTTGRDYTTQKSRRLSCDSEWQTEFDAFLYGYLQGSKARVLLDLRKHDPTKVSL